MANRPLFTNVTPSELTKDIDAGRLNNYPSIIRDDLGRYAIFYEKYLTSGKLSLEGVTFTDGTLNCQVPSGNGEINGTPVTWLSTGLSLSPNAYTLIYVDISGNVLFTNNFPSSLLQNSILLAFANVGLSAIVRIFNIEKTGFYIFYKQQVLSGGIYVWNDYEYRLNVGQKPTTKYDIAANKIFLTYQRDKVSYLRIIEVADPLSWEDISNVQVDAGGILRIIPNPKNNTYLHFVSSKANSSIILPDLFPLARDAALGFRTSSYNKYLYLPYIGGSFVANILGTPVIEIFRKLGGTYFLEASYAADIAINYTGLNTQWLASTGIKYLGVRLSHNLYNEEFSTSPSDYRILNIFPNRDYTVLEVDTHNASINSEIGELSQSTSENTWTKTKEFEQLYSFPEDSPGPDFTLSENTWTKTKEFEQLYSFPEDSHSMGFALSIGTNEIINV